MGFYPLVIKIMQQYSRTKRLIRKPIATTVSANIGGDDGYDRFSDYFVAGGYFIEYVVTPGFTISPKDNHPTSDDDLDSDADPVTGLTDVFIVTPGAGDYSRVMRRYVWYAYSRNW